MNVEVTVRHSDGRTEREVIPVKVGSTVAIQTHTNLKLPAFEGRVTGPRIEVRVIK